MSSVTIIGGGLSGLATAYYLKQQRPDLELKIFEKETSVGGNIRATQRDGFTFDWSANGFLTNGQIFGFRKRTFTSLRKCQVSLPF
jgi:protoporphyrinogen/coproporphyrinogen III oxidase